MPPRAQAQAVRMRILVKLCNAGLWGALLVVCLQKTNFGNSQ